MAAHAQNEPLDLSCDALRTKTSQGDDVADKENRRTNTSIDLAFGAFVRKLTQEILDHRLPITQQPYPKILRIEAACRREFPQFDSRQIRLKIRSQLKLFRRNSKKSQESIQRSSGVRVKNTSKPRPLLPINKPVIPGPQIEPDGFFKRNVEPIPCANTLGGLSNQRDFNNHPQTHVQPMNSILPQYCPINTTGHYEATSSTRETFDHTLTTTPMVTIPQAALLNLTNSLLESIPPRDMLVNSLRMSAGHLLHSAKLFERMALQTDNTHIVDEGKSLE